MIIEIALGIVLAVVILALLWVFLPLIFGIGLVFIGTTVVSLLLYLLFQAVGSEATAGLGVIVAFGGVIAWSMWDEKRKSANLTREKLGYKARSVEPAAESPSPHGESATTDDSRREKPS